MDSGPHRKTEVEYLRSIEALAHDVCDQALSEGWLSYLPDTGPHTPLQRAVNALARSLRLGHSEGDGCLEE